MMTSSPLLKALHKNALVGCIAVAAAIAIFYRSGAEKSLLLGLAIACAYSNALFLRSPLSSFRRRDLRSIAILLAMLATNAALWLLLRFDPLISLLVWLPAIAGVVAARIGSAIKGDRGN